jgi:hypothetical protein
MHVKVPWSCDTPEIGRKPNARTTRRGSTSFEYFDNTRREPSRLDDASRAAMDAEVASRGRVRGVRRAWGAALEPQVCSASVLHPRVRQPIRAYS